MGWTVADVLCLPESYYRTLLRLMAEEAEAIERAKHLRR